MTDQQDPPPLAADTPESPDRTVGLLLAGRYRISGLLARGGMARVYRAADDRLGREVAVKILGLPYAARQAFVERFLEEARAAAGISHPNLVHVYDSGSDGGLHFIVMELLERYSSVRERLATGGPLAVDEALHLASQLLDGLEAGNVLLGPGPVKLIDFGIARVRDEAAGEGISIGSLGYMSPEQLRDEPLGPASDLFAVGVVLYEALTGDLPFNGSSPDEMAAAHAGVPRPPSQLRSEIPPRLDAAILQALRLAPEQRFGSAAAMRRALEAVSAPPASEETTQVHALARPAGAQPGAATSGSRRSAPRQPPAQRPRRRRLAWLGPVAILAAAAIVALLVIVPLLKLGANNGPGPGETGTGSPTATAVPVSNRVTVPNTVGLSKGDAIDAANRARLKWTIECNQDPKEPDGVIRQEPAPGTVVAAGSPFTMYSARIADCR